MESFDVSDLYSKIKKEVKEKPYKILRGTKTLALSSPRYHKFYKSSINLFQNKSFKLPDESIYPKLKKTNYISLKKKINTFDFNSKNISLKKPLKLRPYSIESSIKNVLYEKFKKKKTPNFFIAEDISRGKYYLSSKRYNKNSKSQYDLNECKDIYQLYSIKNSEQRVKDFFMLLNSIFYDDIDFYSDIKYNEKEIFGHKEEYLNHLKDELNNFLKKEKEINIKSDLLQIFLTKKYGRIELSLKSARIDLIDYDNNNNNNEDTTYDNILSISIPFDLMCLIYMCNGKQINYLMLILLKHFKSQKLKGSEENIVIISEEQKKEIFCEILSLFSLENKNVKFNFERYYSQLKYQEKIREINDVLNANKFVNIFYKRNNKINIIDNTNNEIYTTPNYKSSMKFTFDTNLNKYTLHLISERKIYKAQFYMPEIVLTFNHYRKQINHFIDKELFIYLYQNNFMYWDYYILHYLFSYKRFRHFMGGILSIKRKNIKKINYFLSNIEKKRKTTINDSKININNFLPNTKIYKYYLNDLYLYEMNLNENCFEFKFLVSNYNNLYSYKLKSYSLYAFLSNINRPVIYEFNFNFQQMKILYYISLYESLTSFLKKIIYIKDDIIYLDYSYFDSFLNLSNKDIIKYFDDVNNLNIDYKIKEYTKDQSQINSLILIVFNPFIQVDDFCIKIDNKICNKIVQSSIKLKNKFFEELIDTNINEWVKVIFQHKEELDVKNHLKNEDNKKNLNKKRKSINKFKEIHKSLHNIKIH